MNRTISDIKADAMNADFNGIDRTTLCADLRLVLGRLEEAERWNGKRNLEFAQLKTAMIAYFGCEIGKMDDVDHLIHMAKHCTKEWMEENEDLRIENKDLKAARITQEQYIQSLHAFIKEGLNDEPCPDFEKECYNCQGWAILNSPSQ